MSTERRILAALFVQHPDGSYSPAGEADLNLADRVSQEFDRLRFPEKTDDEQYHPGWLIERHVNSDLRYWDGRRIGAESFVASADDAVRFARECDAATVLAWCFEGNGRVAEHVWSEASVI